MTNIENIVNIKNTSAKKRIESAAGVKCRCHRLFFRLAFSGQAALQTHRTEKKTEKLPSLTAAMPLRRRKLPCKGREGQLSNLVL